MVSAISSNRTIRPDTASAGDDASVELADSFDYGEISGSQLRTSVNADRIRGSLALLESNIREQLSGQAFGKALQADQQLYPFCGAEAESVPEDLKRTLDALYSRRGNGEIEAFGANPKLSTSQDRLALIVHQINPEMQTATARFLAEQLPEVPAVALISTVFRVTSEPFLEYFLKDDIESGFIYSNGGILDYRRSDGSHIYRPFEFDFKRLDLAGGFVGRCLRSAAQDAITIAMESAEKREEVAELQVNIISELTFNTFFETGNLQTIRDWIGRHNTNKARCMSLSVATSLIPRAFGNTLPANWQSGPPYVFTSQNGHKVTITFDAE
jgi:hypothetical protein